MTPAPRELTDIDVSLDWPQTARALMAAVEGAGGEPVDGVISIDAVALQDLVWAVGDVKVQGRALALSDQTTTAALEIDSFLGDVPPKAAQLHADRVSEILQAFLDRRPGVETFALATAANTRGRHLSIYLPGRAERRLIRSLGLDGQRETAGRGHLPGRRPLGARWGTPTWAPS